MVSWELLALWTVLHPLGFLLDLMILRVVGTRRLVPSVVVFQRYLAFDATSPTELVTAFASNMIALFFSFESSTVSTPLWAWLPAHGQGIAPGFIFIIVFLFLFSLGLFLQLLPAGFTRNTSVRPIIALPAKVVAIVAHQVCRIICIV